MAFFMAEKTPPAISPIARGVTEGAVESAAGTPDARERKARRPSSSFRF